ncbi:unnamed protein product, partial [Dicrocoelium dendriticum]
MQGRVHFGEPLERACRTTKKLASPEKGRQDLNLRCCQTVRLGVVSPPAAPRPAPKRPSSHEDNDHGPTEKRPS